MTKKKRGGQVKPYKSDVVSKRVPVKLKRQIKRLLDEVSEPIIKKYKENL